MPSLQLPLLRVIAMSAAALLATGCATVPGDPYGPYSPYYSDGGYAPRYYSAPSPAITVYEPPAVIYTSPPPGWRAEAWRERQRQEARERERERRLEQQRREHERREWERRREREQQAERRRHEHAQRPAHRPLTPLEREALEKGWRPTPQQWRH